MVKAPGYKKLEIDFDAKQATVTYDPAKTDPKKIAEAVRKGTGFGVTVKKPAPAKKKA